MKDAMAMVLFAIGVIVVVFTSVYVVRYFSNATTTITLHQPKPGITCAKMVTSDGAAISCWKD